MQDLSFNPLEITVELTPICNLSCKYCYAFPRRTITPPTRKEIEKIFDIVFSDIRPFKIILAGGEPTLSPFSDDVILNIAPTYDAEWAVTTNGTNISQELAKKLKKAQDNYELHIQISLDSLTPEIHNKVRGMYNKVMEGIQNLIDVNCKFSLGVVITRYNIKSIIDILDFASKNNISHVHLMNVMPTIRALCNNIRKPDKKEIDDLWAHVRKFKENHPEVFVEIPNETLKKPIARPLKPGGCYAGVTKAEILSNGDVIPCSVARNFVVGNIFEKEWDKIWKSDKRLKIAKSNIPLCYDYIYGCGIEW